MRKQILSRAFYGWLAYHRHFKTVSIHLIGLINCDNDRKDEDEEPLDDDDESPKSYLTNKRKLDEDLWRRWIDTEINSANKLSTNKNYFYKIIYFNGVEHKLRKSVWPFLFEHYTLDMSKEERDVKDKQTKENYAKLIEEWKPFEEHVHVKEQKKMINLLNKNKNSSPTIPMLSHQLNSLNSNELINKLNNIKLDQPVSQVQQVEDKSEGLGNYKNILFN